MTQFAVCVGGGVSLDTVRHLLQVLPLRSAWCAWRLDVVCRGKRPPDTWCVKRNVPLTQTPCQEKRPLSV